jgi:hypothetical protein
MGLENVDWINLAQDRDRWRALELERIWKEAVMA